jgi:hypothetical protein
VLQLKVQRIQVFSYVCTLALIGALIGLAAAVVDVVLFLTGRPTLVDLPRRVLDSGPLNEDPTVICLKILVVNPVAAFLALGLLGLLLAPAYNLVARITGGVTLLPEIVVAVGREGGERGEVSYEEYIRKHLPDEPEPPAEAPAPPIEGLQPPAE